MKKIFLAFLFIVSSFNYAQAISLSEALFEAYKNNPELNAERENLKASKEDGRLICVRFFPKQNFQFQLYGDVM